MLKLKERREAKKEIPSTNVYIFQWTVGHFGLIGPFRTEIIATLWGMKYFSGKSKSLHWTILHLTDDQLFQLPGFMFRSDLDSDLVTTNYRTMFRPQLLQLETRVKELYLKNEQQFWLMGFGSKKEHIGDHMVIIGPYDVVNTEMLKNITTIVKSSNYATWTWQVFRSSDFGNPLIVTPPTDLAPELAKILTLPSSQNTQCEFPSNKGELVND